MYTAEDYVRARKGFLLRLLVNIIILLAAAGLLALALTMRWRIATMVFFVAGIWAAYFYFSTQMNPWRRYYRLLCDIQQGMERTTRVRFVEVSPDARMGEGVEVHDFWTCEPDDEEQQILFMWDADKPLPSYRAGQMMDIVSSGKYIKSIQLV